MLFLGLGDFKINPELIDQHLSSINTFSISAYSSQTRIGSKSLWNELNHAHNVFLWCQRMAEVKPYPLSHAQKLGMKLPPPVPVPRTCLRFRKHVSLFLSQHTDGAPVLPRHRCRRKDRVPLQTPGLIAQNHLHKQKLFPSHPHDI